MSYRDAQARRRAEERARRARARRRLTVLDVARELLHRRYRVPVNWFAYPSGHYDAAVISAVRAAGFEGSTTVVSGWASRLDDPYRLPRLRVLGGTTPAELLSQIAATAHSPLPPPTYS